MGGNEPHKASGKEPSTQRNSRSKAPEALMSLGQQSQSGRNKGNGEWLTVLSQATHKPNFGNKLAGTRQQEAQGAQAGSTQGSTSACPPVLVTGRKDSSRPSPPQRTAPQATGWTPVLPVSPPKATGLLKTGALQMGWGLQEEMGRKPVKRRVGAQIPALPGRGEAPLLLGTTGTVYTGVAWSRSWRERWRREALNLVSSFQPEAGFQF